MQVLLIFYQLIQAFSIICQSKGGVFLKLTTNPMKTTGRLSRPKINANKELRTKTFVCPHCGDKRDISDVEFGMKYTCPKCGREVLESV